jgi:tetratricopeptide (TPR) repeat protein
MRTLRAPVALGLAASCALAWPQTARANERSAELRARAANELYNLDRERAVETYREAIAADPDDAAAYRGLAGALWLSITFRRGNMTVDDYLGKVSRPRTSPTPPPPETVAAFRDALDRALAIARRRLAANARDADAHYQVGAAVGLRASYVATVDNSTMSAFKAAKEAYEEHEKVLDLDPRRKDAGLIVGTYRYVVAALALPIRLVAYMAGFGGGREKGMQMIEDAVAFGGDNQQDARLALVVIYNREKRYDEALAHLARMREWFPRNRLLWLESGSTSLRANRPGEAERFLDQGLQRFVADTRPRMFGEEALWYYKRGTARAALGRADARGDLDRALSVEGRPWVQARTHLELGKLDLKASNRPPANEHFRTAVRLSESDNDASTADEARRLIK